MAKKKQQQRDRRIGTERRIKRCSYCREKTDYIDYKNTDDLKLHLSDRGKLRPQRTTGFCRRHQSQLATAVKRARELALLPFVREDSR